jgi:hypothetical protein
MSYGIDLAAEWGDIGIRRLSVLVDGLPFDAPVWREEKDEADSWTRADELAALAIEVTDMYGRLTLQAAGHKLKGKPIRINRPDHVEEAQAAASSGTHSMKVESLSDMNRIARFFGGWRSGDKKGEMV